MDQQSKHFIGVTGGAIAFGIWGDLILRTSALGLNYALWTIPLILLIGRTHQALHQLTPTGKLFLGMAIVLSGVPLLRDSDTLIFLCTLASVFALYLASISTVNFSLVHTKLSQFLIKVVKSWGISIASFFIVFPVVNQSVQTISDKHFNYFPALIRGVLISIPLVIVFILLFMSADVNYASMIQNLLNINPEGLGRHVLFTTLFSWIALALLLPFIHRVPQEDSADINPDHHAVPWSIEIIIALSAINLVFMSYVYLQLGYLFGGIKHILSTENLTLADYARSGFSESLIAAGLVLVILVLFDELLQWNSKVVRNGFIGLSFIQIALVIIVILSGLQRIDIYQDSFGLTEDRFYVYAILIWLMGTFCWLAYNFLKKKHHREQFIFGSLVWGYACLFIVIAINPHAHIAKINIDHVQEGKPIELNPVTLVPKKRIKLDTYYLANLSADATPVIIENLNTLPKDAQIKILRHFSKRNNDQAENQTWLSWSWSRSRAYTLIEEANTTPSPAESSPSKKAP